MKARPLHSRCFWPVKSKRAKDCHVVGNLLHGWPGGKYSKTGENVRLSERHASWKGSVFVRWCWCRAKRGWKIDWWIRLKLFADMVSAQDGDLPKIRYEDTGYHCLLRLSCGFSLGVGIPSLNREPCLGPNCATLPKSARRGSRALLAYSAHRYNNNPSCKNINGGKRNIHL